MWLRSLPYFRVSECTIVIVNFAVSGSWRPCCASHTGICTYPCGGGGSEKKMAKADSSIVLGRSVRAMAFPLEPAAVVRFSPFEET